MCGDVNIADHWWENVISRGNAISNNSDFENEKM